MLGEYDLHSLTILHRLSSNVFPRPMQNKQTAVSFQHHSQCLEVKRGVIEVMGASYQGWWWHVPHIVHILEGTNTSSFTLSNQSDSSSTPDNAHLNSTSSSASCGIPPLNISDVLNQMMMWMNSFLHRVTVKMTKGNEQTCSLQLSDSAFSWEYYSTGHFYSFPAGMVRTVTI